MSCVPVAPTEQQYFDMEKRLAEGQEQMLSATKDLQSLKEESKKLSESSHTHQQASSSVIEQL